jgi:hypothetical protein
VGRPLVQAVLGEDYRKWCLRCRYPRVEKQERCPECGEAYADQVAAQRARVRAGEWLLVQGFALLGVVFTQVIASVFLDVRQAAVAVSLISASVMVLALVRVPVAWRFMLAWAGTAMAVIVSAVACFVGYDSLPSTVLLIVGVPGSVAVASTLNACAAAWAFGGELEIGSAMRVWLTNGVTVSLAIASPVVWVVPTLGELAVVGVALCGAASTVVAGLTLMKCHDDLTDTHKQ